MVPLAKPSEDTSTNAGILGVLDGFIERGSPVDFGTFVSLYACLWELLSKGMCVKKAAWDAFRNQNGVGLDDRKMLVRSAC